MLQISPLFKDIVWALCVKQLILLAHLAMKQEQQHQVASCATLSIDIDDFFWRYTIWFSANNGPNSFAII